MINDNTILSSFDDRPTLLEWLKKVEDALKTDSATAVSVENPSANTYVFKITFADGKTLSSGNVVFPDSVKDVSIKNGHIIVTQISGTQTDLGVLNPYADTIVVNAETNTTEIGGKLQVSGEAQVTGNVSMGGNLGVTGQAVVGGGLSVNGALGVTGNATISGRLQADSSIISNGDIRGGNISGTKFLLGTEEMPLVKANPTGEATQTLEKVKIGDVAYNLGGGSDYTAGSNIEISAAKQIAVKRELTEVDSIKLKSEYGDVSISAYDQSRFRIKSHSSYNSLPSIYLEPRDPYSIKQMTLSFKNKGTGYQNLSFDVSGTSGDAYAFLTIGDKVPFVPSGDGTYILKASVASGKVTYTWELQQ